MNYEWKDDQDGECIVDSNNNRCYVNFFGSKEKAEKALKSLEYCRDCRNCSDCIDCSDCSYCSYCSDCRDCIDCRKVTKKVPSIKIENIHQKVLEAVQDGENLEMLSWHTKCGTAHCWAGWIVALAGKEGEELENSLDTPVAALKIVNNSSDIPVHMTWFFESNEKALERIKELAEKEKELT